MRVLLAASFIFALLSVGCGTSVGPADAGSPGDAGHPSDAGFDAGPTDAGLSDAGTSDAGANDAGATDGGTPYDGGLVAARPYTLFVPTGLDGGPAPLVVLLHGYSASGAIQESYFQLTPVAQANQFLYAYPDGTVDSAGYRFWNATDACCNFYGSTVDDVAYVNAVIDDVEHQYNVDPKRIFIVGHSNGAFMAHRLGCDSTGRIAAIVSLAGAQWLDLSHCHPQGTLSVLQVHGTADATIAYDGGSAAVGSPGFPSAPTTVADWAMFDSCGPVDAAMPPNLDIDQAILGSETVVSRYTSCSGSAVELWTIQGGSHIPSLGSNWGPLIYGFLSAHPKP